MNLSPPKLWKRIKVNWTGGVFEIPVKPAWAHTSDIPISLTPRAFGILIMHSL